MRERGSAREDPLALFLTWTTYGSWLPGDERGWVVKPGQFLAPNPLREKAAGSKMTEAELKLDSVQREIVENVVAEHCRIRGWYLHAVNCRTQHVHSVVTAPGRDPDDVLDQFKAWCTRRLKKRQLKKVRQKWWSQGGSKRQLFDEADLRAAIRYVQEGQDD
jgi:REP element-mobilizing transposase RayT